MFLIAFLWQFAKDTGRYIEDNKLRVVLITPPQSPVLLPSNGVTKQEPLYETSGQKDKQWFGVENLPPPVVSYVLICKLWVYKFKEGTWALAHFLFSIIPAILP